MRGGEEAALGGGGWGQARGLARAGQLDDWGDQWSPGPTPAGAASGGGSRYSRLLARRASHQLQPAGAR
eukprot:SAG31_NODE_25541_length_459_cov_1.138889_1_plen_69_part_10